MRLLTVAVTITLLGTSGSALAAECTKGMLWPYTRAPGDCLTEAEIKAGQTGVYQGPVNTNVDVSTLKPEPEAQTAPSSGGMGGFLSGGLLSGPLFGDDGPSSSRSSGASCNKGLLWPFVRDPGDCLTTAERQTNKTGIYRGSEVTQVSATNTTPAPNATSPSAGTVPANAPTTASAPACEKGWLWPFVRKAGDCPTDAEKK